MLQNSRAEALSSAFLGEPWQRQGPWGAAGLDGEPQGPGSETAHAPRSRAGLGMASATVRGCRCGPGDLAGLLQVLLGEGETEWKQRGGAHASKARVALFCRPHLAQHQPAGVLTCIQCSGDPP